MNCWLHWSASQTSVVSMAKTSQLAFLLMCGRYLYSRCYLTRAAGWMLQQNLPETKSTLVAEQALTAGHALLSIILLVRSWRRLCWSNLVWTLPYSSCQTIQHLMQHWYQHRCYPTQKPFKPFQETKYNQHRSRNTRLLESCQDRHSASRAHSTHVWYYCTCR